MAISQIGVIDGDTIGTTEYSIAADANYSSGSPQTQDQAGMLWLDPTNMAKDDRFKVRAYEKVISGGTQRQFAMWTLANEQTANVLTPAYMLLHGWDYTIQKMAGTDRAFDGEVRSVAQTITEASTQSALSVSTTELSLTNGTSTIATNTGDVVAQLWLETVNMAKSDEFVVRIKEKVEGTGGTQRTVHTYILGGTQYKTLVTPPITMVNGWDFTIIRTAGSNRTFNASIRTVG